MPKGMPLPFDQLRDYRLYLPNPTFGNPPWEDAAVRVLIVRLSPHADVQKSTPHLFLAREARAAAPRAFIDLAFLPRPSDAALLEAAGFPPIIGTQSHRPLGEFQLVLVSNAWLLEQVNLPWLLSRSGIPRWAGSRGEEWPPVILGGSNASAAHALVSERGNCMADAIFFGEGEGSVGRLVRVLSQHAGRPKAERLQAAAADVPGLWVAGGLPSAMTRARARTAEAALVPAPVLPGPEAATARVAITVGCPCVCSFCFEGHDRRPFREVSAEEILARARQLKLDTGASTLEVESFNFNTHSGLAALLEGLHRLFLRVNLMSQRVDILSRTPGLLDLELQADKHSYTLGVEGISSRLRRFLHKSLLEEDVLRVLGMLHERPVREVKLFYIITCREQEADLQEFARFVKQLRETRQRARSAPRVVFSFGWLVHMPFTPLRHDTVELDERPWRAVSGRLKSTCETHGFEFRLASSWPEFAASQALSRGGLSLHSLVEELADCGPITDDGLSDAARASVERWLADHRGELEPERPQGFPFPFGFLDDDDRRRFFHRQYERAKEGVEARFAAERAAVPRQAIQEVGALVQRKRRLAPLLVAARVPTEAAGLGREWTDAWLLRELLARHPEQADNVLSVGEQLVSGSSVVGEELAWYGQTAAAVIAWDTERFLRGLAADDEPLRPFARAAEVTEMQVRVHLPAEAFRNPASKLASFLRDAHAPVTIMGPAADCTFEVGEKSRKKRLLLEGSCRAAGGGHVLDLSVGMRPFLLDWLRSFGETAGGVAAARLARVEIRSLGPAAG
ncbi:MAG TPA: radical SAM protein [Spirochaetia bacterium]|nr:radical SAM protein [Spirochaetia bacterium]